MTQNETVEVVIGECAAADIETSDPIKTPTLADKEYVASNMVGNVNQGYVKWFNNRVGYGFVTIHHESFLYDIFVHHTAIRVKSEQYRYLVQGEYVQFKWAETSNKNYVWQAVDVRGINNGPLMCETRNVNRQGAPTFQSAASTTASTRGRKPISVMMDANVSTSNRYVISQEGASQEGASEEGGFQLVESGKNRGKRRAPR